MKRKVNFSVFKVMQFFLLTLLLLSFLLTSGCTPISNLLFGASGSIEVTTYPSGAKIFLNDKDTGYVTPYTIINLIKGTYEVKVALGDISYSKTVIVYSDKTTSVYKDLLPRLNKIIVQPKSINLEEGESKKIDSIVAYYVDSDSVNLTLSECNYSSSSSHAKVNSSGTVTGVSEGQAIITVSYTDVEITKTDTVIVYVSLVAPPAPPPIVNPIVYRALCVGVGDYIESSFTDLLGPPFDVDRMIDIFNHCKFGTDEVTFSSIVFLKDFSATKEAIIDGISSTFSGADNNDVSYFFFSGHGDEYLGIYYLCPTNILLTSYDNDISVNELETALSTVPGRKVVFLDSCHSGGFIGKSDGRKIISKEELVSFNDGIINVFSQAQIKGLLTTTEYKVLTSCYGYQACLETSTHPVDGNPFGWFSAVLCEGCGYNTYNHPYFADNDENNKVSLEEAYLYIESILEPLDQDVQVYPSGSNFTIVEY
jgi:hypothetical protein